MGFMEIIMEKILMNQIKAAEISFNRVSSEATTTAPTQKNPRSLTVSVGYKVVATPNNEESLLLSNVLPVSAFLNRNDIARIRETTRLINTYFYN